MSVIATLCAAAFFVFCLVQPAGADELSDLRLQMEGLQRRVEALEVESPNPGPPPVAATEPRPKTRPDRIRLKGSLWLYYVGQNNSYFGRTSSHFLETTARIGVEANPAEHIHLDLQLIAENAAGDPEDYTGVDSDDWQVEAELANITFSNILEAPFSVTVGRQNLEYGDGFLVYDGVTDDRAAWTTPIRSFYALKGVCRGDFGRWDLFAALVDRDYASYETFLTDFTTRTGRRNLYGSNLHLERAGIWDLGIFYKKDHSVLNSDTLALSQRGSHTFEPAPSVQLTLGGEIVEEFGHTKVQDHALTDSRRDRLAFGGHLDLSASLPKATFSPYLKASYIHLPGDDPDTSRNEAFDPMFYGFQDWGKWYIGSINSYNLFNYNQITWLGEVGIYPSAATRIRGQYFYTALDRELAAGAGRAWSHEVNAIFDWYPDEHFFCGAEFGWAHPLRAARAFAGDDRDTTELVLWAGVQF